MSRTGDSDQKTFLQIEGRWKFVENKATFVGPALHGTQSPVGVCLSSSRFRSGTVSVKARLGQKSSARIVIGFNAATGSYWSVGLGGYGFAYVLDQFSPGQGWRALETRGDSSQLLPDHPYEIQIDVIGQRVALSVDKVRVLEKALPSPLQGNQIGLFAWGTKPVEFSDFHVSGNEPRIFVVMQFGEPYDELYHEVILPVSKKKGFEAFRGDDVFGPGVILQDIIRSIEDSDVVLAEITPVNANVFYELGYAHALNKPTILLANRNTNELPFDISSYRVIFYDDSIRGKRDIDTALDKHLDSVRRSLVTD